MTVMVLSLAAILVYLAGVGLVLWAFEHDRLPGAPSAGQILMAISWPAWVAGALLLILVLHVVETVGDWRRARRRPR